MSYSWYITPEEYKIAESNGINRYTLEKRIRYYGWDKERAINAPKKKRTVYSDDLKRLVAKNGIKFATFLNRVNYLGWSVERAATEPIMDISEHCRNVGEASRKYPLKYARLAERNGISQSTFRARVGRLKWSIEKAATSPINVGRSHRLENVK